MNKENHTISMQGSWKRLIDSLYLIENENELLQLLEALKNVESPCVISFINAHGMNLASTNRSFMRNLLQSKYLLRDGSGMAILLKLLNKEPGLNLNGTDLIPRLVSCLQSEDSNLALLGTDNETLRNAIKNIESNYKFRSISVLNGFMNENSYLEEINKHKPKLIILGMGMPKQEKVASFIACRLNYPCIIVCGGAIIDFIGGKVSRAPKIFRMLGFEWVYRLLLEPRRLFSRYVKGNPIFLIRALKFCWYSGYSSKK